MQLTETDLLDMKTDELICKFVDSYQKSRNKNIYLWLAYFRRFCGISTEDIERIADEDKKNRTHIVHEILNEISNSTNTLAALIERSLNESSAVKNLLRNSRYFAIGSEFVYQGTNTCADRSTPNKMMYAIKWSEDSCNDESRFEERIRNICIILAGEYIRDLDRPEMHIIIEYGDELMMSGTAVNVIMDKDEITVKSCL